MSCCFPLSRQENVEAIQKSAEDQIRADYEKMVAKMKAKAGLGGWGWSEHLSMVQWCRARHGLIAKVSVAHFSGSFVFYFLPQGAAAVDVGMDHCKPGHRDGKASW